MLADPWVIGVVIVASALMVWAIRRDARGPEDAAGVTSEDIDAMIAYGDLGRAERMLEAKLRGAPDDEALKAKLAEVRARS